MSVIESILQSAFRKKASDIFITEGKIPSCRIRGILVRGTGSPVPEGEVLGFLRHTAGEKGEKLYSETGSLDISCQIDGELRFRINFFTSFAGHSMAARPVRSGGELQFRDLHIPPVAEELSSASRGLILVAGSTGSGKSTTLSAMVNSINSRFGKHILTIEDPIEFVHEDRKGLVSQREINTGAVSFASALRSAMRENPDVIVVGEMRDTETMTTAVTAALTGHLVISTVHTSDTVQTLERILNMFPEEQRQQAALDLGTALNAVIAQRLIPLKDGSGMIPAFEILIGTPTVRKMIAGRDTEGVEDLLRRETENGMITFDRAVFKLFREGLISLSDAREAASNSGEFEMLVKGMESGADTFRDRYGSCEDGDFVDMRRLLRTAMVHRASDLHLTAGAPPSIRLNGVLRALDLPNLTPGDIQRLLYSITTRRRRIAYEEKRELDFALSVTLQTKEGGKELSVTNRFRINGFFQRGAPGVVARVVNSRIPSPGELHLPEVLLKTATKEQGLVLVTGPTGSGKSTTLASLIELINVTRRSHIITIEDPIEFVYENRNSIIEQRELYSDTLSYATALKYALRQDPDVIMVGEMRDTETIAAALTAAETGHLVFSTIHTNSAPQTIDRIVDSFPPDKQNQIRLQLAGVLLCVVSQRLIPRIDREGRAAAFEIMTGTPPVLALVRDGQTHQLQSVIETGSKDGMITLEKSMEKLCRAGIIAEESVKAYRADYKPAPEY